MVPSELKSEKTSSNYCLVAVKGPRGYLLEYFLPVQFRDMDVKGCRVLVELGRKQVVGVVVNQLFKENISSLKPIKEILDTTPSVPNELLNLTRWVADYYFCDWVDVIRAALPAGLLKAPDLLVKWIGPEFEGQWPEGVQSDNGLKKLAAFLLASGKKQSLKTIRQKIPSLPNLYKKIAYLESLGLISSEDRIAMELEKTSTIEVVSLVDEAYEQKLSGRAKAKLRALNMLKDSGNELQWDRLRVDGKISRSILMSLKDDGYVRLKTIKQDYFGSGFDPRQSEDLTTLPPLTDEQKNITTLLNDESVRDGFAGFYLTGVPGTGKTRVYLEALKKTLKYGKGALILVPEIGLTPQIVSRIQVAVQENVIVLHSGMTKVQRISAWRAVREGRSRVVVGPRSAVFAPVKNLGLIILDEEHEDSYKQQDPAPRYHARDVALVRATQESAKVILTSATPSLEAFRMIKEKQLTLVNLTERFGQGWPEIKVVDRKRDGVDAPYIGKELSEAIEKRDADSEGTILLHTRRGYAPILVCDSCGEREKCPHCDISMTLHKGHNDVLRCHLCGYTKRIPDTCSSCRGKSLRGVGAGTQRIEDEITERFKDINPLRMDGDSTRKPGAHQKILEQFANGESSILVGTQVVAKGHDFSHVSLVGAVNADTALFQPDFRSNERLFRLLVQAAGRAGRGKTKGEVIIQTLSPEHEVFSRLKTPDIWGFLESEAEHRRVLSYPPYSRMLLMTFTGQDDRTCMDAAEGFATKLRESKGKLIVRGPVQAHVARVKRKWRWRLSVAVSRDVDPNGKHMRNTIRQLLKKTELPSGVDCVVDVDPLEVV